MKLRRARKVICGFSDVTSLHLSILKVSRLRTFYGPSVMCWFGEWPESIVESDHWFLDAVSKSVATRELICPAKWSNHRRRWDNDDWKNCPRDWKANQGWTVLRSGLVEAPIIAMNLNTSLSAAGTPYWPDLSGRILLIEDMLSPLSRTERSLRQLELMGVFDQISGLIMGKPEVPDQEGASFTHDDLLLEVIDFLIRNGNVDYIPNWNDVHFFRADCRD